MQWLRERLVQFHVPLRKIIVSSGRKDINVRHLFSEYLEAPPECVDDLDSKLEHILLR